MIKTDNQIQGFILKGVDNISGPQAIGALQQINPYSEED